MEINFQKDISFSQFGLFWMNEPLSWRQCEQGISINMDAKHDFWRKTYYTPVYAKNDGHFLYKEWPLDANVMVETRFDLKAVNQFDQAGLMVYLDDQHWLKSGIEYVDGIKRVSCVVTNEYSDWSTQISSYSTLEMRVYKMKNDYVVEVKNDNDDDKWSFIRICHLNVKPTVENVKVGLYTCAPKDAGGSVTFQYVNYKDVDTYHHSN